MKRTAELITEKMNSFSVARFTGSRGPALEVPALKCWAIFKRPLCGLGSIGEYEDRVQQPWIA